MTVFKILTSLKNRIMTLAAASAVALAFSMAFAAPALAVETGDTFNVAATVNGTANSSSADSIVSGSFYATGNNGTLQLTYIADLTNRTAYISGASYSGTSTFHLDSMPSVINHPNDAGGYIACDVYGIYDSAFKAVGNYISGITIPSSYKSIGANAFYECKNLSSVSITEGLETIGSRAFYNCIALSNGATNAITIPSSVKSVGDGAFAYCTTLENIYCGSNNNYYMSKNGILYSNDERTIVAAPAGKDYDSIGFEIVSPTKVINVLAFAGCTKLRYLDTVADTLTSVGERAFEGCTGLTRITMPAGVSYIGTDAFKNCNSGLVVTCTKSNTSVVADYCKQNKISTTLYCIVTFYDEKGAELSRQTVLYGGDAVAPTVTVPSGYTMSWSRSYVNVTDSIDVKLSFLKNVKVTFKDLDGTGQVTEVDTSYGVAATPPQWTRKGYTLEWDTTAYLHPTKDITVNAVWLVSLTGVPVEENKIKVGETRSVNGITYMVTRATDDDARVKVVKCTKTTLKTVTIPSTVTFGGKNFKVTNIGKNAFRSMEKLTTVDIGSNMVNIGTRAFYNCKKLKKITIRSKKIKVINEKAFTKTSSSATVNVPNSLVLKYKVYLTDAGLSKSAKVA
ncbi:MAG: leucine-rich repeat domain-containing protein [Lachnospiraceae bacterium]|nr:leucine-rich repeat domain-containing protein [Lachnospiraceae bacterium]